MPDTATSLNVFILTFNAAKTPIDSSIFAHHLQNAFAQNATGLPELIVFCLQEMAPLAHSFIGSYMINPYFQRYVSAVDLASSRYISGSNQGQEESGDSPYTLVITRNVGMTGIMLFARNPSALHNLKSAEVSFGAGDMANKGAVGLRMLVSKTDAGGQSRETELTFVGTHLAAHEWNLEKRNKNWQSIVSGLLFEGPSPHTSSGGGDNNSDDNDDNERELLLSSDSDDGALHALTIYKPGSHLFVAGDLNYRISQSPPHPESQFPELDPQSAHYFPSFLALDQLTLEKEAGRTLHGLSESPILFPPTYKLEMAKEGEAGAHHHHGDPSVRDALFWKWASHRWPGWCDRVLYLDVPSWVSSGSATKETKMNTIAYDALPPVRTSDHRPVFLRVEVPVLEPSMLSPPHDLDVSGVDDPRINLPYAADRETWGRRARAKRWEAAIGWSILATRSKPGIAVFVTLLFVCLGTFWFKPR